ncbi:helix-turn-helix domain-containing protein [Croceicoccus mobilis]|uniref:HTH cro/C1-type domain-containing protein n=1 Tax=Croceicoccus mobilis TaxID=1703339 RepID=A0A916Z549_9SPHN|nr:helix-turn-helix transcriptional regulator [Croceicoccus mobilis]GGD77021.1 hypothetical protein GCM10010990_28410 [Croceicoccus mobilis]
MTRQVQGQGSDNDRIARVLAHAVDSAGRSRADLAAEAGMHRETLTRLIRGERPIKLEDAARILSVCGVPVRATLIMALNGEEERACQWMRHDVGAFLEEFLVTLPGALETTLGDRCDELRPRWAKGTSQLVARMLANHIDDFAARDVTAQLAR